MADEALHYRTCIVRAWLENSAEVDARSWRMTLEVPALGLRRGFHDREELIDVLLSHLFTDLDETLVASRGP